MRLQDIPTAPGIHIPARRYPFERNLVLTIAQFLAVAQGILGLINGITQLQRSLDLGKVLEQLGQAVGRPDLASRAVADMVSVIVISVLVIAAAAVATRPSNIARWWLVAWESIALVSVVVVLVQFPLLLGVPDLVIVSLVAAGVGFLHPVIIFTMAVIVIFGFAVYPPTWAAYRR